MGAVAQHRSFSDVITSGSVLGNFVLSESHVVHFDEWSSVGIGELRGASLMSQSPNPNHGPQREGMTTGLSYLAKSSRSGFFGAVSEVLQRGIYLLIKLGGESLLRALNSKPVKPRSTKARRSQYGKPPNSKTPKHSNTSSLVACWRLFAFLRSSKIFPESLNLKTHKPQTLNPKALNPRRKA